MLLTVIMCLSPNCGRSMAVTSHGNSTKTLTPMPVFHYMVPAWLESTRLYSAFFAFPLGIVPGTPQLCLVHPPARFQASWVDPKPWRQLNAGLRVGWRYRAHAPLTWHQTDIGEALSHNGKGTCLEPNELEPYTGKVASLSFHLTVTNAVLLKWPLRCLYK